MKIIDRILFVIIGLFLVSISAGCILLGVDYISVSDIIAFIGQIRIGVFETVILLLAAIATLLMGLKIIFARPKKLKIEAYTIRSGDDGDISVSLKAIENTIKLAVAHYDEIKDVKLRVTVNDGGISISARLAIPTGVVLPELLESFNVYLKDFVEKHTGVPVAGIRLVATEYKQVDPESERKRISARNAELTSKKNVDAYAHTHATVVPKSETPQEDVVSDSVDAEDIDSSENN